MLFMFFVQFVVVILHNPCNVFAKSMQAIQTKMSLQFKMHWMKCKLNISWRKLHFYMLFRARRVCQHCAHMSCEALALLIEWEHIKWKVNWNSLCFRRCFAKQEVQLLNLDFYTCNNNKSICEHSTMCDTLFFCRIFHTFERKNLF